MKIMPAFFLLFLLLGCHKDNMPNTPIPVPDPNPSKLEILWQAPIMADTSEHSTSPQAITNGAVLFSTNFTEPSAFVQMREEGNGAFRWKFDNFIVPVDGFLRNEIDNIKDKIIVNVWHRTYCLDSSSGNLDWVNDVTNQGGYGERTIEVNGDYVYKGNITGVKPISTSESIVRAHYLQGKWDTLLTINAKDSFNLNLLPPTFWINPQGDSILIIRDNGLRNVLATPYEGRYNLVNIYAWNMRTRQYEWKLEDFQDQFSIDVNKLVVDGNNLFLHTKNNMFCLNLIDGSLLWKKHFDDDIYFGNLILHKNLIIVHGDDHGLWALNKSDGSIVWYNKNSIGTVVQMRYFDGVVYYVSAGSGLLYAVNADTGAFIWNEYTPTRRPDATFGWSSVLIDPVRRVLYTADSYYMMCIKLPKI